MTSIAAASRLLTRLLSSSISAAVAASFGGGAARNSRPEEITQVFQDPAFGSIRPSAIFWANDLGISSNTQSPPRRAVATEMRFIASSLVGDLQQIQRAHTRVANAGCAGRKECRSR